MHVVGKLLAMFTQDDAIMESPPASPMSEEVHHFASGRGTDTGFLYRIILEVDHKNKLRWGKVLVRIVLMRIKGVNIHEQCTLQTNNQMQTWFNRIFFEIACYVSQHIAPMRTKTPTYLLAGAKPWGLPSLKPVVCEVEERRSTFCPLAGWSARDSSPWEREFEAIVITNTPIIIGTNAY